MIGQITAGMSPSRLQRRIDSPDSDKSWKYQVPHTTLQKQTTLRASTQLTGQCTASTPSPSETTQHINRSSRDHRSASFECCRLRARRKPKVISARTDHVSYNSLPTLKVITNTADRQDKFGSCPFMSTPVPSPRRDARNKRARLDELAPALDLPLDPSLSP